MTVERSKMSGEFFNLYLHQNFLDFFQDVEDVARASKYLSDADLLTTEWSVSIDFLEKIHFKKKRERIIIRYYACILYFHQ